MLHQMHMEQQARRLAIANTENPDDVNSPMQDGVCVATELLDCMRRGLMTQFTLADIVCCDHGPGGRCLHCVGRYVQNVPLPIHNAFCTAYETKYMQSTGFANELSLASLASLVAILAPEPGERLLHLGSGLACAAVAWALMLPGSAACGIEDDPSVHKVAQYAKNKLGSDVRDRVYLHCGDAFRSGSNGEWREASVIFVTLNKISTTSSFNHLLEGLSHGQAGTRVVACG